MDQESLINGLAAIGALSVLYIAFRILAGIAQWVQRDAIESERAAAKASTAKVPAPVTPSSVSQEHEDVAEHDIAVIAAAVQAMMGNHHVLHIQDAHSGQSWSAEGRWMHQTSHRTH
ncbi:MAG TPA: hypothetical protein VM661_09595 [Candidatus Sulfotelmatobacter sp.]|jgi:hypothetical protein|nr:hypothetical protein [Candidatus Sulfotelmatobacter sp.]